MSRSPPPSPDVGRRPYHVGGSSSLRHDDSGTLRMASPSRAGERRRTPLSPPAERRRPSAGRAPNSSHIRLRREEDASPAAGTDAAAGGTSEAVPWSSCRRLPMVVDLRAATANAAPANLPTRGFTGAMMGAPPGRDGDSGRADDEAPGACRCGRPEASGAKRLSRGEDEDSPWSSLLFVLSAFSTFFLVTRSSGILAPPLRPCVLLARVVVAPLALLADAAEPLGRRRREPARRRRGRSSPSASAALPTKLDRTRSLSRLSDEHFWVVQMAWELGPGRAPSSSTRPVAASSSATAGDRREIPSPVDDRPPRARRFPFSLSGDGARRAPSPSLSSLAPVREDDEVDGFVGGGVVARSPLSELGCLTPLAPTGHPFVRL